MISVIVYTAGSFFSFSYQIVRGFIFAGQICLAVDMPNTLDYLDGAALAPQMR